MPRERWCISSKSLRAALGSLVVRQRPLQAENVLFGRCFVELSKKKVGADTSGTPDGVEKVERRFQVGFEIAVIRVDESGRRFGADLVQLVDEPHLEPTGMVAKERFFERTDRHRLLRPREHGGGSEYTVVAPPEIDLFHETRLDGRTPTLERPEHALVDMVMRRPSRVRHDALISLVGQLGRVEPQGVGVARSHHENEIGERREVRLILHAILARGEKHDEGERPQKHEGRQCENDSPHPVIPSDSMGRARHPKMRASIKAGKLSIRML